MVDVPTVTPPMVHCKAVVWLLVIGAESARELQGTIQNGELNSSMMFNGPPQRCKNRRTLIALMEI